MQNQDTRHKICALSEGEMRGAWATYIAKGDTFRLNGDEYMVTVRTSKTLRLKKNGGQNYTFVLRGRYIHPVTARSENLPRDIEGALVLDLLNERNPFHKPSDVFRLTETAVVKTNRLRV